MLYPLSYGGVFMSYAGTFESSRLGVYLAVFGHMALMFPPRRLRLAAPSGITLFG